jgi:hypothetical protein
MAIKRTNMLRYCPMCNTEIEASNFYQSMNPHHNGYLLYCKDHCDAINKEYKEKTNDQTKALWYTCAELGVPFVLDVYKKFEENKKNKIETRTKEIDPKNGKTKYSSMDMMKFINDYKDFAFYYDLLKNKMSPGTNDWSTFYSGTDVDWKDVSNNIKDLEVKESEKQKFILDWGYQEDVEDYEYLEYQFYELTENIEFQNKAQEELYRDLCLARLAKRKIESGKNKDGDISKVQNQILSLMKTLKIDNFEEKKEQTIVERMLESRIAVQEKEKPAFYYDSIKKKENVDYLGRGKYFYDHIYRPFHNVLEGSKLYKILPEEEDDTKNQEYEKIMEEGKVKEVE